jgi:glyceraldehyde 3-phosphate dehydrogenase
MANIAINGFGRIGRQLFKAGWQKRGFDIVAINDLANTEHLAHLLKYDSTYGIWPFDIKAGEDYIQVGRKKIPVFQEKDPSKLPWKKLKVDIAVESTGYFESEEGAGLHLEAGAKRVIISAPAKGNIPTYVFGANEGDLVGEKKKIISNASCTTNCASPVMAILEEAFGIEKAMLTTVHGYTATQNLVDGNNSDLRRARAAALNMVPTSTGAAIATTKTLPSLEGKFDGISIRVPVPTVSLSDIVILLKQDVTEEEVNDAFRKAIKTPRWKNIVDISDEPLVSTDYIGNPYSAIVDADLTRVVDGNLVKIVAWYDNEWGYSQRLAEMVLFYAKQK